LAIREYIESDMLFQFDSDKVFLPEKEQFVIFRQHVKSCDFIWLKETKTADNLFFIEARNTAPFQQDTLETYLQKIHDKFCHSLLLYIAALFDRMICYRAKMNSFDKSAKIVFSCIFIHLYPLAGCLQPAVHGQPK